jgi:hypothetical protein
MERQESILSWVKLNQNSNFGLRSLFATYIYIDHFILIIIIILFTEKDKKNDKKNNNDEKTSKNEINEE